MTASTTGEPHSERDRFDRAADERSRPDLLTQLRADPATRVLVVRGDGLMLETGTDVVSLRFADPREVSSAEWAFLGRSSSGEALLLAALDASTDDADEAERRPLREVGGELSAEQADLAVTAVALGRWLLDHPHCSFCGARTELRESGWSRRCPACGRLHFPRTDPAVIVAVSSPSRPAELLLGSNAAWPAGRYSCFAGFVEAGESLEDAVRREVREESGVEVSDLRYRGSQGWPYPRSLMLGFQAVAARPQSAVADGDEIVEVRWFSRDEIGAALAGAGDVTLPGPASIARRLIHEWFEAQS